MLISSRKRPLKKQKQENLGLFSQSNEETAYTLYFSYKDAFMNYTHLTTKIMLERPNIADWVLISKKTPKSRESSRIAGKCIQWEALALVPNDAG